MSTFSDNFLSAFPSKLVHHNEPQSVEVYHGKMMTPHQKQVIIEEVKSERTSQVIIANYLGVQPQRLWNLMSTEKQGKSFREEANRPSRIDDVGRSNLVSKIIAGNDNKKPYTKSETYQLVKNEVAESDKRIGGKNSNGLTSTVSYNTTRKILEEIDATFEKGQTTTKARYRESQEIRNMVTLAAMNEAFAAGKPPHLIGNFDATQFVVSDKNGELLVTIKKKCSEDEPVTLVEDAILDQAIKWMFLCTANGHLGDDVFLISDSTMDAEEFQKVQIRGLTHNSRPADIGWLCFCKTRYGDLQ
jgi:hypothetical protein